MSSFEILRIVDNFYQTSLFFPMPTVVISTLCEDGTTTLGPYSLVQPYYVAGKDYYAMLLSCRNSSNTAQNILRNGKCAINFVDDKPKTFAECVKLSWPGDKPEDKMPNCQFKLEKGQTLGIVDTLWALILPGVSGVFNIYLIKQFMASIPKELDEAAMIDGANRFQIYWKIIIPLCVPVLIVVGMFAFTGAWNDYLWPSIVMNKIDMLTITPGMQKIKDSFNTMPGHAIAGGFISVIPTFIVYLFAQKHFMKGMQLQAGVKG